MPEEIEPTKFTEEDADDFQDWAEENAKFDLPAEGERNLSLSEAAEKLEDATKEDLVKGAMDHLNDKMKTKDKVIGDSLSSWKTFSPHLPEKTKRTFFTPNISLTAGRMKELITEENKGGLTAKFVIPTTRGKPSVYTPREEGQAFHLEKPGKEIREILTNKNKLEKLDPESYKDAVKTVMSLRQSALIEKQDAMDSLDYLEEHVKDSVTSKTLKEDILEEIYDKRERIKGEESGFSPSIYDDEGGLSSSRKGWE